MFILSIWVILIKSWFPKRDCFKVFASTILFYLILNIFNIQIKPDMFKNIYFKTEKKRKHKNY